MKRKDFGTYGLIIVMLMILKEAFDITLSPYLVIPITISGLIFLGINLYDIFKLKMKK